MTKWKREMLCACKILCYVGMCEGWINNKVSWRIYTDVCAANHGKICVRIRVVGRIDLVKAVTNTAFLFLFI